MNTMGNLMFVSVLYLFGINFCHFLSLNSSRTNRINAKLLSCPELVHIDWVCFV